MARGLAAPRLTTSTCPHPPPSAALPVPPRSLLPRPPPQLSRFQPRAPGAAPRGTGPLETYLRRDDKIDLEDVIGLPELKPRVERLSTDQLCAKMLALDR